MFSFIFAQASFVASGNRTDISLDDPNFWDKWAKKAEIDMDTINGRVSYTCCMNLKFHSRAEEPTSSRLIRSKCVCMQILSSARITLRTSVCLDICVNKKERIKLWKAALSING